MADKEGYFNAGTCFVSTEPVFKIDPSTASVAASETSAQFTLLSTGSANQTWNLSVSDSQMYLSVATTGTGSKLVTVNFPPNGGTNTKTYTVTASRPNSGFADQTFTITQAAPEFSLSTTSATVGPDASRVSFDLTSTGPAAWTVSPDNRLTDFIRTRASVEQISGTGNATITMAVPANTTSGQITYVIKATCPDMGVTDDNAIEFTIRQDPLTFELLYDGAVYDETGDPVEVKATWTTATFTVNTNSAATWTITSQNVTSATQNDLDVVVTFPQNTSSTADVTRSVTVNINGVSKTINIKHLKRVRREITFNTNSQNFPEATSWFGSDTNSAEDQGITLSFDSSSINDRRNGYLEFSDSGTFTLSSDIAITAVTINYTDYNHGASGRNGNYSSSSPATQSGYVYATSNGKTGTWTGNATSITFTLRRSRVNNTNYYIQISSVVVTIEE